MFIKSTISATSQAEAKNIAQVLLTMRLIAGTLISFGESLYRWDDQLVQKEYWNFSAFSALGHKIKFLTEVKNMHGDDFPIVTTENIDGNQNFLDRIKVSTA